MNYHLQPARMDIVKKKKDKCGEDVENKTYMLLEL